jgi:hypothetical protein
VEFDVLHDLALPESFRQARRLDDERCLVHRFSLFEFMLRRYARASRPRIGRKRELSRPRG